MDKDISDWSGDYFEQFHRNISYIVNYNAGCWKALTTTLFFIIFVSLWFTSIVLEIMCETFVFYKFIAYLLWPNGLSSKVGNRVPSLLDYNFTTFHIINDAYRPVFNSNTMILGVGIIVVYAILKPIILCLLTEDKQRPRSIGKKCSAKLFTIFFETLNYFINSFFSMFIGVFISAFVHYELVDTSGGAICIVALVLTIFLIIVNLAILQINKTCHCVSDRVITRSCFDLTRIIAMLLGGYLIFWKTSVYDDESVLLFFFFNNYEWNDKYDYTFYVILFFFPYLVFFAQNTFSEFWEVRLTNAFYKDTKLSLTKMVCTLCCRTSIRNLEDEKDWIYPDECDTPELYDTELPIYDSVCTVYWQRPLSVGDSSILTFSSDGGWYNYQSFISNIRPYSDKWYFKDESGGKKLKKFGGSRLRLSKVMALSGGAVSLWMGSFFADKRYHEHVFSMIVGCFTHLGASMGGWIRTTPTTSCEPLFMITGTFLFMLPIVLMIILADAIANNISPSLAAISWLFFFIFYFIFWNMGRMENTRWVKLFEYFFYPFKLNFLIGAKTWVTSDPPIDRVYLSDGCHKDNYALTSLILRRRCKKILICEGSSFDPPLSGLLQAFYWSDCFSDYRLEFYFYKEDDWRLVEKGLYEDFFRQHKKNKFKTYEEKVKDKEDIKKKRIEWSDTVMGGKELGRSPYCWMFKVTYGLKKTFREPDTSEESISLKSQSSLEKLPPSAPLVSVHSTTTSDPEHLPDKHIKEAFMWLVAPPIDGELVDDGTLTPKSQCENHIVKDGNFELHNLSGCCCDCCHKVCLSHTILGTYPHFSIINQSLTPSQNSALHVAGTLAAEKALELSVNRIGTS